jgi:hypothetical protein
MPLFLYCLVITYLNCQLVSTGETNLNVVYPRCVYSITLKADTLSSALYWHFTQRIMAVPYRRFGKTFKGQAGCLTLEDGTDRLVRNVFKKLPLYAAQFAKSARTSCTPRRKPAVKNILHCTQNFILQTKPAPAVLCNCHCSCKHLLFVFLWSAWWWLPSLAETCS